MLPVCESVRACMCVFLVFWNSKLNIESDSPCVCFWQKIEQRTRNLQEEGCRLAVSYVTHTQTLTQAHFRIQLYFSIWICTKYDGVKNRGTLRQHHNIPEHTRTVCVCSDRCEDTSSAVNDHSTLSPPAWYPQPFQIKGKLICSSQHSGSYMDYGLYVYALLFLSLTACSYSANESTTQQFI